MVTVSWRALVISSLFVLSGACNVVLGGFAVDDTLLENGVCQLGEHRCSADWLLTCNDRLDGWHRERSCATAELCDSRNGACNECRPFDVRCNGAALEVCRDDGSGWNPIEQCSAPETCNVNLASCAPCSAGEYQCNGSALSQCTAQGTWGTPTQCAAPELCVVSEDRRTGMCQASAGCAPDSYACMDARLVRCDSDGVVAQPIETCASAALCQLTLSKAGATPDVVPSCIPPGCDAGERRCDGPMLMACSADRASWVVDKTCSADAPCNPALADCAKCTPDTVACQGSELWRCDTSGAFQKISDCASAELCDATSGRCLPKECDQPGRSICDANAPVLETCGSDFKWHETLCDTTGLCNANDDRCEVPTCELGATRCDHGRFERCNASRTGWQTERVCDAGSVCDPESGLCSPGPCTSGAVRCNDVFLEVCDDGAWQPAARCASATLCDASGGSCTAPKCALGTFRCEGQIVQKCGADRNWEEFRTCVGGQCDDIGGTCL